MQHFYQASTEFLSCTFSPRHSLCNFLLRFTSRISSKKVPWLRRIDNPKQEGLSRSSGMDPHAAASEAGHPHGQSS